MNLHIPTKFSNFKSKFSRIFSTAMAISCPVPFLIHFNSRNDDFRVLSDILTYLIAAP